MVYSYGIESDFIKKRKIERIKVFIHHYFVYHHEKACRVADSRL